MHGSLCITIAVLYCGFLRSSGGAVRSTSSEDR